MEKNSQYLTQRLKMLKKTISDSHRRPLLFVGSGLSQRYFEGFDWSSLLRELFDYIKVKKPFNYYMQEKKQDLIKIADVLVTQYKNYYWKDNIRNGSPQKLYNPNNNKDIFLKYQISQIINQRFSKFDVSNNQYKDELDALSKITPQIIITTNYDNFLEKIFPKYSVLSGNQTLMSEDSNNSFNILKIHGSVDQYSDIVIDSEDYKRFYKSQLYLVSKMITYFIDYPIVFLGYGLNDPDIKRILGSVVSINQTSKSSPILDNMWFIDWNKELSSSEPESVPDIKYIRLNGGKTVGLNYIELSSFTPLYEAMRQDTVDIYALKSIQHTVYDIMKSASITNLKVDIANIEYLKDPNDFLSVLANKNSFVSLSKIEDPNQLATMFPYTPTELAHRVFDNKTHWQKLYQLIDNTEEQLGMDIRKTNNDYHVSLSGISRYSEKAVSLLRKLRKGQSVVIEPGEKKIPFHLT